MKKLVFVLSAILLSSHIQAQSQSDFYGTWIYDNGTSKMERVITSTIFISSSSPNFEQNTFEIFSWERITNDNAETKNNYPTGYLIGLRHGLLGNTTASVFIHRNKNSLISTYRSGGNYYQDVYIKIGGAVFGQEFFNFLSQIVENFPANEQQANERLVSGNFTPVIFSYGTVYTRIYNEVKIDAVIGMRGYIIGFTIRFEKENSYKNMLRDLTSYFSRRYNFDYDDFGENSEGHYYTFGSKTISIEGFGNTGENYVIDVGIDNR